MKYREKVIANYKLLGAEEFVKHQVKNDIDNLIRVRYDERCASPNSVIKFSSILHECKAIDILIATEDLIESLDETEDYEGLSPFYHNLPAWIPIIYAYLESHNKDQFIWID